MDSEKIHYSILSILCLIVVFLTSLTFLSLFIYKNRKIKEDVLLIEKSVMQIFTFGFFSIVLLSDIISEKNLFHHSNRFIIIPYIVNIFIYNFFISYEGYKQIIDPCLIFRSFLAKSDKKMLCEILVISSTIIIILILIEIPFNEDESGYLKFLFTEAIYFLTICLIISSISIFMFFIKRKGLYNYKIENKKNAIKRNISEFINNICYFIIVVLLLSISIYLTFDKTSPKKESYFTLSSVYIFILTTIIDGILTNYNIYNSDFYTYTLSFRYIGYIFRIFGKNVYNTPTCYRDSSSFGYTKENSVYYYQNELSLTIDEYSVDAFDNIINISLASIYLIFSNKHCEKFLEKPPIASPSESNYNKRMLSDIEVSALNIDNAEKKFRLLDENEYIEDNTESTCNKFDTYNFKKIDFFNENLIKLISSSPEKHVSGSNLSDYSKDNLNIKISSMFTSRFNSLMRKKNIDPNVVKQSLISHLSPSSWKSLLEKNSKEDSFKKQLKLVLKTYDNLLSFEILDEDSVLSSDNMAEAFMKKYFEFMMKNNKSFLPIILGIFNIKIKNFKEIRLVLSKNFIIQEFPREYFNYWQLIRINKDKEMICSSKDRLSSIIVKDELLFKNEFKLILFDYQEFLEILNNDFTFFKKLKVKDFSLLLMYYEIGKGYNDHSIDGAENSPIQRTTIFNNNNGATRISRISNNKFAFNRENENILGTHKDNDCTSLMEKINLFQFKEKNGFEGKYNNFKCVLFFAFENIFQTHSFCYNTSNYSLYRNNILNNFNENFIS